MVYRALLLFGVASAFTDGGFTFLKNEEVYVFDVVVLGEEEYRDNLSLYVILTVH